jgi:hypothetical protein
MDFIGALSNLLRVFSCLLYAPRIRGSSVCWSICAIAFASRDIFASAEAQRLSTDSR